MRIAIVGTGNMGEAILRGLLENLVQKTDITALTKTNQSAEALKSKYGVNTGISISEVTDADVIFIGVKPQSMDEVLPEIGKYAKKDSLIISLAVGVTTATIAKKLKMKKPIVVRAMPNTPSLVGQGVTGLAKGKDALETDLVRAKELLSTIGIVVVVEEKLIDVLAATSGSGPAYYFYVTECLIEAAIANGLDKETAQLLVENTFLGSAELFKQSDDDVITLRNKVTSPKGTTQSAIEYLERKNLRRIWTKAIKAAIKRAKAISKA